jgi:hypothetical protein
MVANESTQRSHAPPKQSTAHEKMTTSSTASQRNCQPHAPVLLLLLFAVHVRFGAIMHHPNSSHKHAEQATVVDL